MLLLGASFCWAATSSSASRVSASGNQELSGKAVSSAAATHPERTLIGRISVIKEGNPKEGMPPALTVAGRSGKTINLVLGPSTKITNGDKTLTLNELKTGEKILVNERTLKNGDHEAVSIRVVK